jgi:hypothetical protein
MTETTPEQFLEREAEIPQGQNDWFVAKKTALEAIKMARADGCEKAIELLRTAEVDAPEIQNALKEAEQRGYFAGRKDSADFFKGREKYCFTELDLDSAIKSARIETASKVFDDFEHYAFPGFSEEKAMEIWTISQKSLNELKKKWVKDK